MHKKNDHSVIPLVIVPRREKFAGERIEEARLRLREDEVYAEAQDCAQCLAERDLSADETALCEIHLQHVLGTIPRSKR